TVKEPNHRHRRLLRACRERPHGRAAEQRDEIAAPHALHPKGKDQRSSIAGRSVHRSKSGRLMSGSSTTEAVEAMARRMSALPESDRRRPKFLSLSASFEDATGEGYCDCSRRNWWDRIWL